MEGQARKALTRHTPAAGRQRSTLLRLFAGSLAAVAVVSVSAVPAGAKKPPVVVEPIDCTIRGTCTSPTAVADSYPSAYKNQSLEVPAPGVLGNDKKGSSGGSLSAYPSTWPAHEQYFKLNKDGSFSYLPDTNWVGTDQFTYYVKDIYGYKSQTATVTVAVSAGHPPKVTALTISPETDTAWPWKTRIDATVTDQDGDLKYMYVDYGDPTDSQTWTDQKSVSGSTVSVVWDQTHDYTNAVDAYCGTPGNEYGTAVFRIAVKAVDAAGNYDTTNDGDSGAWAEYFFVPCT